MRSTEVTMEREGDIESKRQMSKTAGCRVKTAIQGLKQACVGSCRGTSAMLRVEEEEGSLA